MSATVEARASLLRDLVIANRILAHEGVLDAFGHVSVRDPDDPGRYLIARQISPERVTEADLQCFTLEGVEVSGDERPAYAERAIHGAIYEARPDVMAVCHNHAPSVVPFGVAGLPLRAVCHVAGHLGTGVPIWDIADEFGETDLLVRTMAQGRSLARALGGGSVVLMRGHGSVVASSDLQHVVFASVYTERNAALQAQALALGQVRYLSAEEARLAAATHAPGTRPVGRAWDCWKERLRGPAREA